MKCMRQFKIKFECEICGLDTKDYNAHVHRCVECGRIYCPNCRHGALCKHCYKKLAPKFKKEFEQKRVIWRLIYIIFTFGMVIFTSFLFANRIFTHPNANQGIGVLFLVIFGFILLNKYHGWIHGPLYHVAEHLAAKNFSFLRKNEKIQSSQMEKNNIKINHVINRT